MIIFILFLLVTYVWGLEPQSDTLANRTYIALPYYGKIRVMGYIDSNGSFHSIEWTGIVTGPDKKAYLKLSDVSATLIDSTNYENRKEILLQASVQKWYCLPHNRSDTGPYIFSCDQFPADSIGGRVLSAQFYENFENEVLVGPSLGDTKNLPFTIFASRPLAITMGQVQQRESIDTTKLKSMLDSLDIAVDSVTVGSMRTGTIGDYIDVQITGAPHLYKDLVSQWALFDTTGKLLWPPKGYCNMSLYENSTDSFNPVQMSWFTVDGLNEFLFSVSPYVSAFHLTSGSEGCTGGDGGFQLLRIGPDGVKSFDMRREWW